jgi:hypothetical protein
MQFEQKEEESCEMTCSHFFPSPVKLCYVGFVRGMSICAMIGASRPGDLPDVLLWVVLFSSLSDHSQAASDFGWLFCSTSNSPSFWRSCESVYQVFFCASRKRCWSSAVGSYLHARCWVEIIKSLLTDDLLLLSFISWSFNFKATLACVADESSRGKNAFDETQSHSSGNPSGVGFCRTWGWSLPTP